MVKDKIKKIQIKKINNTLTLKDKIEKNQIKKTLFYGPFKNA
jgi:hypothetical protein